MDNISPSESNEHSKWSGLQGKIIGLEGLIGVGKSTLGRSLVRYLRRLGFKAKFFPEFYNKLLLGQYLSNMEKYAYSFQVIMVRERIRIYKKAARAAKKGKISIIDRSLIGDVSFANMQRSKKLISDQEWETYISLIRMESIGHFGLIIYLQCNPEEAFSRMRKRSISAEVGGYDLQYFQDLENSYKYSINNIKPSLKYIPWNNKEITVSIDGEPYLCDNDCCQVLDVIHSFYS